MQNFIHLSGCWANEYEVAYLDGVRSFLNTVAIRVYSVAYASLKVEGLPGVSVSLYCLCVFPPASYEMLYFSIYLLSRRID